ncbi:MAG: D-alanine--D-alanine ligase family protein [Oscillospiraceae bacterium]
MSKTNLCVIFGGVSSEHEISRLSATTVIKNINKEKYNLHMIMITKSGTWFYYDGDAQDIVGLRDDEICNFDEAIISPSRKDKGILRFTKDGIVNIPIDVIIPVLHGKNGEDGTIQGLFELSGIPYVGSGVIGSSVCMDKCIAKIMFSKAEIPQAEWVEFKRGENIDAKYIEDKIGYPCFIKPSNAGSSVGVTKAIDNDSLLSGINLAFEHDYKVLIEEALTGSEVECSVLGNFEPVCAAALGEIGMAATFYDYDAKYKDENSKTIIPAILDKNIEAKLKKYALKAYKICECRGLSRVDFFVNKETGEIKLNEINTLPGFTSISMYPKMWEKSGVNCSELLDKLINLAQLQN